MTHDRGRGLRGDALSRARAVVRRVGLRPRLARGRTRRRQRYPPELRFLTPEIQPALFALPEGHGARARRGEPPQQPGAGALLRGGVEAGAGPSDGPRGTFLGAGAAAVALAGRGCGGRARRRCRRASCSRTRHDVGHRLRDGGLPAPGERAAPRGRDRRRRHRAASPPRGGSAGPGSTTSSCSSWSARPGGNARSGENEVSAYPVGRALHAAADARVARRAAAARRPRRAAGRPRRAGAALRRARALLLRRRSGSSATAPGTRASCRSRGRARGRARRVAALPRTDGRLQARCAAATGGARSRSRSRSPRATRSSSRSTASRCATGCVAEGFTSGGGALARRTTPAATTTAATTATSRRGRASTTSPAATRTRRTPTRRRCSPGRTGNGCDRARHAGALGCRGSPPRRSSTASRRARARRGSSSRTCRARTGRSRSRAEHVVWAAPLRLRARARSPSPLGEGRGEGRLVDALRAFDYAPWLVANLTLVGASPRPPRRAALLGQRPLRQPRRSATSSRRTRTSPRAAGPTVLT